MAVEDQVVAIYAVSRGHVDDIPVDELARFEHELLSYMKGGKYADSVLKVIRETGKLPEEAEAALKEAIETFKEGFSV